MSGGTEPPDVGPAPISWEALAAELEATREQAELRGDADPDAWDAVARELAARVAERPSPRTAPARRPIPSPKPSVVHDVFRYPRCSSGGSSGR